MSSMKNLTWWVTSSVFLEVLLMFRIIWSPGANKFHWQQLMTVDNKFIFIATNRCPGKPPPTSHSQHTSHHQNLTHNRQITTVISFETSKQICEYNPLTHKPPTSPLAQQRRHHYPQFTCLSRQSPHSQQVSHRQHLISTNNCTTTEM